MSDLTVYAEALIATVARAFYEDDAVCLVDVLLRDKFLRDDDMSPRLSLPAKQLRRTLQFLTEEHIVKYELVDDLSSGGSQATKFWYIDYNYAVNAIRLRIHLIRKNLEKAELQARSSSFYLCPGYKEKRCNGRYTETEAQQIVDQNTGLFLCRECFHAYAADPQPPPIETYTLDLVDKAADLKKAVDNLRRFHVQLSGKMIGNHQVRASIYDLLQKVRSGKAKGPLSSNLPSENFALGIGSKRLAGTGRTAGIKAKKLAQQGVASAESVQDYLGGTKRTEEGSELTFLKNAIGQEISFTVEKGGGARANVLATNRRRRRKLMDAAASRVGADLPLPIKMLIEKRKRRELKKAQHNHTKKTADVNGGLHFLNNNIGRTKIEEEQEEARQLELARNEEEEEDEMDGLEEEHGIALVNEMEELQKLSDEERRSAFQSLYKIEMGRQIELLRLDREKNTDSGAGLPGLVADDSLDETSVAWEDG